MLLSMRRLPAAPSPHLHLSPAPPFLSVQGRRRQHSRASAAPAACRSCFVASLPVPNRTANRWRRNASRGSAAQDSSDEESDGESSPKASKRRGRKKATVDATASQAEMGTEGASGEETKKVPKKRGRKKVSGEEEKDKAKEPKKRGRRKLKAVEEESTDDEGEHLVPCNVTQDHISAIDLESRIESLASEDIGEVDSLTPLVCCFGPAKSSFIPSGRPADRLVDREIHSRMKGMFWTPDEFVRAPGGSSSYVALTLAALGAGSLSWGN